jgi:hypothetical protein
MAIMFAGFSILPSTIKSDPYRVASGSLLIDSSRR